MKNAASIKIGQLFARAMVESLNKDMESRLRTISLAREHALELCASNSDKTIVECRAIEAILMSGLMNNQVSEVIRARETIATSRYFDEDRRDEMLFMADRFISRQ